MTKTKDDFYYTTLKLPKEWRDEFKLISIVEGKNLNDVMANFIKIGYRQHVQKNGKPQLKIEELNKGPLPSAMSANDNKSA